MYGLRSGWNAVFETVRSIQPPLINLAFVPFFFVAAKLAAADPVLDRHVQRIPFGALVLEFMVKIVVTASLWLLDAVEKV